MSTAPYTLKGEFIDREGGTAGSINPSILYSLRTAPLVRRLFPGKFKAYLRLGSTETEGYMKSYVERTLASGEEILAVGRFHWTYTLVSFLWLILLGWALIGIVVFAKRMVDEISTEIAVTNRRFVYKTGLLFRDTNEFTTTRIEGVNLAQSLLGRMLNYGKLRIRGSGIGEVDIPPIADPLTFRRALIDAHRADEYGFNLEYGR